MYAQHPSKTLNELFSRKPFQGAEPESATYLFVGLDANYSPTVEQNPVFPQLLEYLEDGVGFWKAYGVHHPFLLPAYKKGDGWKYHHTFSKIGFRQEHAPLVSFIELLHVPTSGRSQLEATDLNREHLERLHKAIQNGVAKHVFIPDGVARLMRNFRLFSWLPKQPLGAGNALKLWFESNTKQIHWHYHFSVYGKFEQQKKEQLNAIGQLLAAGG